MDFERNERNEHDERIAAAIRALADHEDGPLTSPPADLWARIEGAIEDPRAARPGTVEAPPDLWERIADAARAESHGLDPDPSRDLVVPIVDGRQRGAKIAGLVAAAVVLVGLLVGALALVRANGDAPASELVARATLTGEGIEPGGDALGDARLTEVNGRWTVSIDVEDLPDPPEGSYYEAWLLGSGPDQVQSLGTLEGAEGFTVPAGLEIADFPVVDVSIEPIDGDPAHSSLSVLRGRLAQT